MDPPAAPAAFSVAAASLLFAAASLLSASTSLLSAAAKSTFNLSGFSSISFSIIFNLSNIFFTIFALSSAILFKSCIFLLYSIIVRIVLLIFSGINKFFSSFFYLNQALRSKNTNLNM
jgi:hypothetical protein